MLPWQTAVLSIKDLANTESKWLGPIRHSNIFSGKLLSVTWTGDVFMSLKIMKSFLKGQQ